MTETAKEVTERYFRNIIQAASFEEDKLAFELLKEYGALAYKQGWDNAIEGALKFLKENRP